MIRILLASITILFLSTISRAQVNDVATDYLTAEFHKSRRDSARAKMPDNSVLVVFAFPTRTYSNDVSYVYHANPDLYYFTGYKEPHGVLFIFKESQQSPSGSYNEILFIQERNARAEQWTGRRIGVEGVKGQLGFNNVYNGREFGQHPLEYSKFTTILMDRLPMDVPDARGDSADLFDLIRIFKLKTGMGDQANANKFNYAAYRQLTGALREIKTQEELILIRKAIEISCVGQSEVMRAVHPKMSEREVQGLHEFVHKKYGAENVGYPSIVGAGNNGCVLHYEENGKLNVGKDMLLMDVGAEYHGYTADVTRTIPASGRFTSEQRAIYQLVYDAQEACFAMLKEGVRWSDVNAKSREVIAEGLLRLGVVKRKEDANKYYPHGLGHHIGLDVHDRSVSPLLKKDMVMTIEPGIYIPENSDCDKKWWGIAVRIEDDVLIRDKDYELLSTAAPRKIEDIEKLMAEKSILENYTLPPLKAAKKAF
ncbi:MAG: aminopeptidase P family protein [Chitinophagaceae bacterium]|nr:MAG: aminopeptidase P family protein [Chitinophagaceae bacterium]